MKKKAIVIGAGISGLAIAVRLRILGYEVDVYDSNAFAGGKISEMESKGFRFDAGPSLFTMPHLVEELFWIAGKSSKTFEYKRLEEVCRYFYPDGTRFSIPSNSEKIAETLSENLGEEKSAIINYLARSQFKYETVGKLFLEKSLRKPSTFFNSKAFKSYLNLPKLGLIGSLHNYNKAAFKNPKTVQLFDRYATYNGSDPYQTPAIMSMIPHLELGVGAYFPKNGMYQIAKSIEKLAKELGVNFHWSQPVTKILTNPGKGAFGVEVNGNDESADVVISAIDVSTTYKNLLQIPNSGEQYKELPKSTSAIIFYWGIRGKFDQLGLHNIFFSADYRAEFKALFSDKVMPDDPTIYLNISSKQRAEDAPEGCENWFVMVNAPANEGQPWDDWIPKVRDKVLKRLSIELNQPIESLIETELLFEPRTLESRTGAVGGALYGSNSNSQFAAFLRHANVSNSIPHLYFCGGTVHPGGGIPLALQSAAIAADYLKEREK